MGDARVENEGTIVAGRERRARLACAAATGVALAPVALFPLGGSGHLLRVYGGVDYALCMHATRRFPVGVPLNRPA